MEMDNVDLFHGFCTQTKVSKELENYATQCGLGLVDIRFFKGISGNGGNSYAILSIDDRPVFIPLGPSKEAGRETINSFFLNSTCKCDDEKICDACQPEKPLSVAAQRELAKQLTNELTSLGLKCTLEHREIRSVIN